MDLGTKRVPPDATTKAGRLRRMFAAGVVVLLLGVAMLCISFAITPLGFGMHQLADSYHRSKYGPIVYVANAIILGSPAVAPLGAGMMLASAIVLIWLRQFRFRLKAVLLLVTCAATICGMIAAVPGRLDAYSIQQTGDDLRLTVSYRFRSTSAWGERNEWASCSILLSKPLIALCVPALLALALCRLKVRTVSTEPAEAQSASN